MTTEDLSWPRRVHFVGLGGAGMSGIAKILLQRGHQLSGSDLKDSRGLEGLRALGAEVTVGHDAAAVGAAELVVRSAAVPDDNPELRHAASEGIPILRRAEMLAALMADQRRVLVAGTHGKTTTTSMLVVGLQGAGHDPSFAIGGSLNEIGTNAHAGLDPIFVAEADESDRSFLVYEPDLAVVTNVELDHPEEFRDDDDVERAFVDFLGCRRDDGLALLCLDDPGAAKVAALATGRVTTYGTTPGADWRLLPDQERPDRAVVRRGADDLVELRLSVPGLHNLRNATAALAAIDDLGGDLDRAAAAMNAFQGAQRRFQRLGERGGVAVVDDYAHHPTELRATMAAARGLGHERIVLVVQPHRYSRTATLGAELGEAAAAAEVVIVTDVFGSGERPIPGVSGQLVADAVQRAGGLVFYEPRLDAVADLVARHVRPGTLVLVTGAGDVTRVGPAVLARLR